MQRRAPMRLEKSPPSQITSFELVSVDAITWPARATGFENYSSTSDYCICITGVELKSVSYGDPIRGPFVANAKVLQPILAITVHIVQHSQVERTQLRRFFNTSFHHAFFRTNSTRFYDLCMAIQVL